MTPFEIAVAALVVAAGAALQGGLGFGMNLVAAPVLTLIDPVFVPGPALVAALLLTVLVAHRERTAIDRRGVGFALAGRVPGTVLGAALVASVPKRGVAVAVGLSVLLAVALNLVRIRLRPDPGTLVVAGAVSGFAGTVSSVGGPPIAVVYANEPGPVARGSLSAIFVVGALMSVAALVAVGDFGRAEAMASLLLVGPGAAGFAASRRLAAYLDAGRTRPAVLGVAALGAVSVLVAELV